MDFKIRENREPQGHRKLTAERQAYSRRVQQGSSNTEACRIVGINERTGRRWLHGRGPSATLW
jgi:hypothetical protein